MANAGISGDGAWLDLLDLAELIGTAADLVRRVEQDARAYILAKWFENENITNYSGLLPHINH